ncbi:MAG: AAA family ATPase [Candidatus Omnitrophica bacterium]|nr:AAA family ATPase [Candidatus Omnitrophota bacterium]
MRKKGMIIVGPPGSGKTTVVGKLSAETSCEEIKTGRILREEAEKGTEEGRKAAPYIEKGMLAPSGLVGEIVKKKIASSGKPAVAFDGYPRNMEEKDQLLGLSAELDLEVSGVFLFEVPYELAEKRISGRRVCSYCGRTYNVHFDPPAREGVCDIDGEMLVRRGDDSPANLKERMDEYQKKTVPAIRKFQREMPERFYRLSGREDPGKNTDTIIGKMDLKRTPRGTEYIEGRGRRSKEARNGTRSDKRTGKDRTGHAQDNPRKARTGTGRA